LDGPVPLAVGAELVPLEVVVGFDVVEAPGMHWE
jgi:hypothetical protein